MLAEINVQEGETVAVGTLICSIAGEGGVAVAVETGSAGPAAEVAEAAGAAPSAGAVPVPAEPAPVAPAAPVAEESSNGRAERGGGRASPAVRRLADEHDLDLGQVRGTGIGGRVTKKDVEQFIASGASRARPAGPETAEAPARQAPAAPTARPLAGDELIPLTPMRKAIAEHMVRSRQTSPHAWCATEVDMTNVVKLRAGERERFRQREGVDLSYVPFVIKAAVESLKDNPSLNATWTAEAPSIARRSTSASPWGSMTA